MQTRHDLHGIRKASALPRLALWRLVFLAMFVTAWSFMMRETRHVTGKAEAIARLKAIERASDPSFDLAARRFSAPGVSVPSSAQPRQVQLVHAAVASVSGREAMLRKVVDAILPQVDVLHVYLNGYERVPDFLVGHPAIQIARSQDSGDVRDNGKFFFLDAVKEANNGAYYLTIDDDLVYPSDYVRTLLLAIEKYERRAIVGFHGVVLADPMTRFYDDRIVLSLKDGLAVDQSVHLLGTGALAFHKDTIDLHYDDFGEPGMADLWLAIAAKRQSIPMRCIAREKDWLVAQDLGKRPSLYWEFKGHDDIQTRVAKQYGPWNEAVLVRSNRALAADMLSRFELAALASRGMNATELVRMVSVPVVD